MQIKRKNKNYILMKNLNTYISEKLKINKNSNFLIEVSDKEELKNIIKNRYKELTNSDTLYLNDIDVSNITDMMGLFFNLDNEGKLKTIDISSWDTSKVTNMRYMFRNNDYLKNIIVGDKFNTSNVTDMSCMFTDTCIINPEFISKFDTSSCETFGYMFSYCKYLKTLDISSWDVSNIKSTQGMFMDCRNLTDIGDILKWDISNVKFMQSMFENCKKLKLDLSSWKLNYVNNNINSLGISSCAPNIKI